MRKRIVPVLLAMCLLLVAGVIAHRAQAVSVPENSIYVAKNEDAGLMGDVLLYAKKSDKYVLYLPGSADASKLCFSWADSVTVTDESGAELVSGELSVPAPGASVKLVINGASCTVETLQGSKETKAMFLEIDPSIEGYYSFSEMNTSADKSQSSAGTMAFGQQDGYYFSIKGRGNATWTGVKDKKPYNITLYKDDTYDKTKGFELIEGVTAKKWSLLANYYDGSLIRNKLAYDMAVALGIGLESAFVDLWVDGEYRGNYLMTPKNDYDAPEEGYMLEIDNYTDDDSFKISDLSGRITVKDNGADLPLSEIKSYMTAAWKAIKNENSEEYLDYIDLDSWAKFYLLHEFYMSFDMMRGSQFMYREGTAATDKLFAGPIWDMDNSLGKTRYRDNIGMSYEQQHTPYYDYLQSVDSEDFWLQELGQHESFMKRVYEIYDQYQQVFDNTAKDVVAYKNALKDSALMNFNRWSYPERYHTIPTNGVTCSCCVKTTTWEHYVINLRSFAAGRAAYLDTAMRKAITGTLTITGQAQPGAAVTANVANCNAENLIFTWTVGGNTVTGSNQLTLSEADCGKVVTCTVTSDKTSGSLTATLSPVTVSLSSEGGTGVAASVARLPGVPYGNLPTPAKDGWEFLGWFTGPNGSGTAVTAATPVTAAAHTLYAIWKQAEAPTEPTEPPTEPTQPVVPTEPTEPATQPTQPPVEPTQPGAPTDDGDNTAGFPVWIPIVIVMVIAGAAVALILAKQRK